MNGSNKILTVSYGTFSCTLEGFDDPFNSMRSIAEYFRDLAADDRYFGAEPPTPDVEMLQALAQRGAERPVSARLSDGGIALSVSETGGGDDTAALATDDDFMSDEPEDALIVGDDDRPAARSETIADKLSRIRAVVSRQQTPVTVEEFAEDDNAPEPPRSRALTRTLSDIAADIAGDEDDSADEASLEPRDEAHDATDDTETESSWDAPILAQAVEAVHETAEDLADDGLDDDTDDAWGSDVEADIDRDEPENAFGDLADAESEAAVGVDAEDVAHGEEIEEDGDEGEDEDDRDDIRAKAALFADGTSEEADPGEATEGHADDVEATVEDDFDAVDDDDEDDGDVAASDAAPSVARRESRLLEPVDDDEAGVGRLMNEAEGKLADDDSIRRRRVISQMRAAVAATRADRILSRVSHPRKAEGSDHAYRADLDRAVAEPRKSSPLVLVSAQRVEEPTADRAASRTPSSSDIAAPEQQRDGGAETSDPAAFARFVEDMEADGLPELLEAAAAYAAFVEGEPHFSRPDLMRRVAEQAHDLHMSREQGLRSFGQLLREGKIRKLQRGQFTIDEGTRFNPAHRIAGE